MAAAVTGKKPHVLAVPVPAQGHVLPLMTLCRQIAKRGVKVTFLNAQSVHDKIASAAKKSAPENHEEEEEDHNLVLTTFPDRVTSEDDPDHVFKLIEALPNLMPQALTDLIERINTSNPDQKISCVIADFSLDWVFDIAAKMGAELVEFSPISLACWAVIQHSQKLLEEGRLNTNGFVTTGDVIKVSDDIPTWRSEQLPWNTSGNPEADSTVFEKVKRLIEHSNTKWKLCNSCYELEPGASEFLPAHLPVGPLNLLDSDAVRRSGSVPSSFYSEDASCLSWLGDQSDGSVIYVSFGSTAMFSQQQLDELAFGLELSGRAFIWVTRPNLANGSRVVYPDGFLERVSKFGKIVEWAPQDKVLSHPSIGCFVSHCGWNSTLEGVSRGVPFLCMPYFGDQQHNESYICDMWENGLKISLDEQGIRSRHEIKKKIDMLFSDNKFKQNALKLKEMCAVSVSDGGTSNKNLEKFIHHILGKEG